MRGPEWLLCGAVTALLCTTVVHAGTPAAFATVAGRVKDSGVAGSTFPLILHRDGSREPARAPALIYAGDHIHLAAGQQLAVNLGGTYTVIKAPMNQPRDYLVEDPHRGVSAGLMAFYSALENVFVHPQVVRAVPVIARDEHGRPLPSRADPLVPVGRQFVPRDQALIAVIWSGPAAAAHLVRPGHPDEASHPGTGGWATFAVGNLDGPATVALSGAPLAWQIDISEAIPGPPGIAAGGALTPGDRLARAIWLLRDGPPEWRLFAISEIAALAPSDFIANELWDAAQKGALDAAVRAE
jgi:hypothetical protein